MYTVHATKKLLDRVKQRPAPGVAASSSVFGNWYATYVGWRPQVVLFVNERTLLAVLVPLAPAATVLARFPQRLAEVLGALDVPDELIDAEMATMGDGVWSKTANRSVVGSMNEFVFLADAWRARGQADDLLAMSLRLAEVPCSPLAQSETFPDREVAALVDRWRAGELAQRDPSGATPPLASPAPSPVGAQPDESGRPDPRTIRNRRRADQLSEREVEAALGRIGSRSEERARDARHIYDTLTWGEGPARITQAVVQDWLWYRLPNKYLTDEPGYTSRLAGIAAELFDELELVGYATICRSRATVDVHAAFERSPRDGFAEMSRALAASGIEPPDTDELRWGDVMGIEESAARSAVEDALERAIDSGGLVVGERGWRGRQQAITADVLDADHPTQPGQSWRTAIATERIGSWIGAASRRPGELGRLRSRIGNRLLHPIDPPTDVAQRMVPITWLLQRFGSEQALTQAGYLNRPFVVAVHSDRPWDGPFDTGPPRSETEEVTLHRLRGFLERAGALRKRAGRLQRTRRGAAMAVDPAVAWTSMVEHLGGDPWNRFVVETYGMLLLDAGTPTLQRTLIEQVVALAGEAGWRIGGTGGTPPAERDIAWSFGESRALLELCGLLREDGDWSSRRHQLTDAGERTALAMLRATAAGPRVRP